MGKMVNNKNWHIWIWGMNTIAIMVIALWNESIPAAMVFMGVAYIWTRTWTV